MKQSTFEFDDDLSTQPDIHIASQHAQQLVEWMAQAIVSVFQDIGGEERDES